MKKSILLLLFLHLLQQGPAQTSWVQTATDPGHTIRALASIGNNIFAGTSSAGVFVTADQGTTWTQRNGAFPMMSVYSLAVSGTDLFAGADPGIFKSSDNGLTWVDITPSGFIMERICALAVTGTHIYAGVSGNTGVVRAPLSGISSASWTNFNNGLPNFDVRSLKISGTNIYAGTYSQGVWVSSLNSDAWMLTSATMPAFSDYIQAIDVIGNTIVAGNISGSPTLYRSTDRGLNWLQSSTAIFNDKPVYAITNDGTFLYAGVDGNDGIFISADSGITWATYSDGFKDPAGNWYCNGMAALSFLFHNGKMYAGTGCGIWRRDAKLSSPPPSACTYTYSDWGPCINNVRVRTMISALPAGCTGTPVLSQSCSVIPVPCTYTYSDWSPCVNNVQTRTVLSSLPTGCTGTPVLSQTCSLPPIAINEKLNTYPNPANGTLNLKVSASLIGSDYTIIDQMGKPVQTGKITTTTPAISTIKLRPGMYIFKITQTSKSFKFFKD